MSSDKTIEIDVIKLMRACLNRWWQIVFAAIIGGALTLFVTVFFVTPTYESTTKIYVNNSDISLGSISISSGDITASNSLVKVYIEILNTKKTMDVIINSAGLDYNYLELMRMIEASESNGTPVLKITVTSRSPDEAHLIASTIANVLPGVISFSIQSSRAVVVDDAIYPTAPSGPNDLKNTAIGALSGMLIVVLIIMVRELLSVEITSRNDVSEITDLPILGSVTDFGVGEHGGKYYRDHGYYRGYTEG